MSASTSKEIASLWDRPNENPNESDVALGGGTASPGAGAGSLQAIMNGVMELQRALADENAAHRRTRATSEARAEEIAALKARVASLGAELARKQSEMTDAIQRAEQERMRMRAELEAEQRAKESRHQVEQAAAAEKAIEFVSARRKIEELEQEMRARRAEFERKLVEMAPAYERGQRAPEAEATMQAALRSAGSRLAAAQQRIEAIENARREQERRHGERDRHYRDREQRWIERDRRWAEQARRYGDRVRALEGELARARDAHDEKMRQMRAQGDEAVAMVFRAEAEARAQKEAVRAAEARLGQLETERRHLQEAYRGLQSTLRDERGAQKELSARLRELVTENRELASALRARPDLQGEVEALRGGIQELKTEREQLRDRLERSAQERKAELDRKLGALRAVAQSLQSELGALLAMPAQERTDAVIRIQACRVELFARMIDGKDAFFEGKRAGKKA
jgi:ParB family chromosome partitioning protein